MPKILIDLCKTDAEAGVIIADRHEEFELVWDSRPTATRVVIHDYASTEQAPGKNRIVLIFRERST